MKKVLIFIFSFLGLSLIFAKEVFAVCPICTVAVGAGVGFSRWLGIDDTITGLWIGGLTVSMITWTIAWFQKKQINFKGIKILTVIGYYLIVVLPLYFMGLLANPLNAIYSTWVDKILIGVVIGSIGFWLGAEWYYDLKKKNNGHSYFPFQKVVMPIAPLIIMSVVFYFLTK
jgi:hypothetical protein